MKQFWIIVTAGTLIIAGSITLTNYIEHRNKYRETTPKEREEYLQERQRIIDSFNGVKVKKIKEQTIGL